MNDKEYAAQLGVLILAGVYKSENEAVEQLSTLDIIHYIDHLRSPNVYSFLINACSLVSECFYDAETDLISVAYKLYTTYGARPVLTADEVVSNHFLMSNTYPFTYDQNTLQFLCRKHLQCIISSWNSDAPHR